MLKVLVLDHRGIMTAVVVGLSIFFAVIFAKTFGCMLPLFGKKIGLDPAVMSSPLLTTIVDAVTLLIFFTIASNLLM